MLSLTTLTHRPLFLYGIEYEIMCAETCHSVLSYFIRELEQKQQEKRLGRSLWETSNVFHLS